MVANIGEFQCSIKYPLIGSLLSIPWLLYSPVSCTTTAVLSCAATKYKGLRWRKMNPPLYAEDGTPLTPSGKSKRRGHCANFSMYFFCATLWLCVIVYAIYFNGEVTMGGEKVPVHEAVKNFFKSQAWKETKDSLYKAYELYKHRGFWQAYEDVKKALDLFGEGAALETVNVLINLGITAVKVWNRRTLGLLTTIVIADVLTIAKQRFKEDFIEWDVIGLEEEATQEEITKRCRQLSRDNHPDRQKTEAKKAEAQERFIEIQEACGKLSDIKTKRARKNRRRGA
ncbi:DnaJ subfamily C member [Elysia marginata]|uniref:DnaJ subfamily C member n=1 Tax=Elysia marginata TaxID=1093978 RepID=A0AAV4EHW7_9GAST|nr:DnaJ subfamily C member [Elysia marginata]